MRISPQLDQVDLLTAIHSALTNWNNISADGANSLNNLLIVQEKCAEYGDPDNPIAMRQATNIILESAISELSLQDINGAAVLRARFIDESITRQVAAKMHASPDQVNRWQRAAIENLTQIIYSQEKGRRKLRSDSLKASLPLSGSTHLFGFDDAIEYVAEKLIEVEGPGVIAITGIGGIGKTSLAHAVVLNIISTLAFDQVVWLQASMHYQGDLNQVGQESSVHLLKDLAEALGIKSVAGEGTTEQLMRLRQMLDERLCLVIIDNLETEEQSRAVLDKISKLAGPTKFLLTTRARPLISAPAFFYSVEELSLNDAADLLSQHAQTLGNEVLAAAKRGVFEDIYQTTGGNPLALKLVVGLASALPLEQILAGLERSRPGPIEDLYRHIYLQAWRTLSPNAQDLLQAMPLIADAGGLPEQMMAIGNLSESEFWPAVRELFSRSLLEVRGDVRDRRYGIHRLTETFLRTEIIDWPQLQLE